MTDERDPSIFYKLSGQCGHKLHYFKVARLPRIDIRKHKISSPIWWHSKHRNYGGTLGSWLKDRWMGSIYFYKLPGQFANKLNYFRVGIT
jgi:hypothetical protein